MTNYINSEILCEAYSKLNIDIFHDKKKLAILRKQLTDFFEERAKFSFGDDVEVLIEFEEGSLITKLTVVGGAVAAIAAGIAQYGSFREGVIQIADDAALLAHSANYEVTFRTKAAYCDRIDAERRRGIFGRVDVLLKSLDSVHTRLREDAIPRNPASLKQFNLAVDDLIRWELTSDKFFARISDQATIACLAAGLLQELESLPEEPLWSNEIKQNSLRANVALASTASAGNIAAAAARMKETVKELKKSMRRRITPSPTGVA